MHIESASESNPKPITASQLVHKLESQCRLCAYTGDKLDPETASLDHVIPLSRGGKHAISNMAIVRHDVNTAKGTMTLDEFVAMCRAVAAYADRQGERKSRQIDPNDAGGSL